MAPNLRITNDLIIFQNNVLKTFKMDSLLLTTQSLEEVFQQLSVCISVAVTMQVGADWPGGALFSYSQSILIFHL